MNDIIEIFSDGGARGNPGPAACAFVVIKNSQIVFKNSFYLGVKTNNQSEYEGVIRALKWLSNKKDYRGKIIINLDSQLVVRQLQGVYKVKNLNILEYFKIAKNLENKIQGEINFVYIPREKNQIADKLLNDCLNENV